MADKPDDLFSLYLAPAAQRQADEAKRKAEEATARAVTFASESQFAEAWMNVYSQPLLPDGSRNFDQEAEALLALVDGIEARYWDFDLAFQFDAEPFLGHNIALAALVHACRRDKAAIVAGLTAAFSIDDLYHDVIAYHAHFYNRFASMTRPPLTPPITEVQLAEVLGMTRTKLNNEVRTKKKWVTFGKKQSRRWSRTDRRLQPAVLDKFREFFPSKPWLQKREVQLEKRTKKTEKRKSAKNATGKRRSIIKKRVVRAKKRTSENDVSDSQ
ncbi:MAG: hypothetical protein AABP62_22140 [Planctomycetota bacterium]